MKIFIGEKELLLPPRCMTEIDGEDRGSIHRQTSPFFQIFNHFTHMFCVSSVYSMSDQHVEVYFIEHDQTQDD